MSFQTFQEAALPPYDREEAVRVQCRCRWCKHRWIEDGTVRARRDHRGRRTVTLASTNGASHRCASVDVAIERALAGLGDRRVLLGTPGKMTEQQYAAGVVYGMIDQTILKCSYREDVPCNAKCTGAVGPRCDCSCGGKNHGASTKTP